MATLEQEEQTRSALKTILGDLSKIDPERLARTDVLGSELNFQAGVPYFRRILDLFASLARTNLDDVPHGTLELLRGQASNVLTQFRSIQAFSPSKENNPVQVRDNLITQVRDAYDGYYRTVTPWIAYLSRTGSDFAAMERQARDYIEKIGQVSVRAQDRANQTAKEIEQILKKVKTAAAEVGVSQHSTHFHDEAEKHRYASRNWFITVCLLTAVGAGYSLWYFQHNLQMLNNSPYWWTHLGYFGSRLLVLSIIFFGIGWSASNFKSHKHNEVINTHRQNALRTFETFVKATEEKETKDAVLLAATKSIFEGQSSGYLTSEHEHGPSNTIIEILKNVAPGKK